MFSSTRKTHTSLLTDQGVCACVRAWGGCFIRMPVASPVNTFARTCQQRVCSDRGDSAVFVLLWQVPREDLPGVLSQELLEDGREGDHRLAGAQLGTLHHALLVIDKEVGAAGQHRPALLRARLGGALCTEVGHEPVNQLAQVPAGKRTH